MAKPQEIQAELNRNQLQPATRLQALVSQTNVKKRFEEILGKKAPAFISSIISVVNSKRELMVSDPNSILGAAVIAATLDLPINSNLGFAHIVPYSGHAQFQMGWKGFVQLAIRTGLYKTIHATEIYDGELISYHRLSGETVIEEDKRKSDKVIGYIAYFKLMTGFEKSLYMTVEQVRQHAQKYSKSFSKAGTPWQVNFDQMALKTVVKLLLSKWGILSVEIQRALQSDQAIIPDLEARTMNYMDGRNAEDTIDATPIIEPTAAPVDPNDTSVEPE